MEIVDFCIIGGHNVNANCQTCKVHKTINLNKELKSGTSYNDAIQKASDFFDLNGWTTLLVSGNVVSFCPACSIDIREGFNAK
jgi:hypothetical protein